jgi:hypothetical protein
MKRFEITFELDDIEYCETVTGEDQDEAMETFYSERPEAFVLNVVERGDVYDG